MSHDSVSLARCGIELGAGAVVDIDRNGPGHRAGAALPSGDKRIRISPFEIIDASKGEHDAEHEDAQGNGDKDNRMAVG